MVTLQVLGLTWGEWDEPIFDLHPDIILGADVLYDSASELVLNCVQ
jgi:methyltransferase-like protein 23